MNVVKKPIEDITPYEKNARKYGQETIDAVANSIEKFGWQQPLVVDKNLTIIVGHVRYEAAKKLGCKKVPVIIASRLSKAKVAAYRLADNKLGELSSWNFEQLSEQISQMDANMLLTVGFDEIELDTHKINQQTKPEDVGEICQQNNEELTLDDVKSKSEKPYTIRVSIKDKYDYDTIRTYLDNMFPASQRQDQTRETKYKIA